MKVRDRDTDIFSLAFLDIISCSFGAVVLLLIISRPDMTTEGGASESMDLLRQIYRAEAENIQVSELNEQEMLNLEGNKNRNRALANQIKDVQQSTRDEDFKSSQLANERAAIEQKKNILKELIQLREVTPDPEPVEEVGGIAVDSDYVIFIIDTSGSMREKWSHVKRVMHDVLTMHPKVKGFQILNDNGFYMKKKGGWINDTKGERSLALIQTNRWSPSSNSNPYEGIVEALRAYGRPGRKLSLYVFGDDFASLQYDNTVASISNLNNAGLTNNKLARIHGIGFASSSNGYRVVDAGAFTFSVFMSAVARENNGTYLSLSR